MRNRLFSVNNPVVHCARKRVRRDWRATLLAVATLMAMAALCGWLWSCVRSAAHGSLFSVRGSLLAMATPSVPVVLGITLVVMAGLMAWAVRSVRENERWIEAWRSRRAAEKESLAESDDWLRFVAADEGIRAPGVALPPEELRRIVGALVVETCQARDYVRKAQGDLSVEDYGEKLSAAEASLSLCIRCLGGLLDRVAKEQAGSLSHDEGRAA